MLKRDIVVIGASAGGVEALKTVLSGLPKDFPASVFVTIHTMPTGPGYLAQVLARVSPLPVEQAKNNEEIRAGFVYVAQPNLHLIMKRGRLRNRFLPKENGTRPAIDPMFRSAAQSYSRRVIGVLLTGELDDGTAGLGVIKDEGGIIIVQDPKDAMHPDMPTSAIQSLKPDYVVPLAEIAPLLVKLVKSEISGSAFTEQADMNETEQVLTCPGCGGVLREYRSDNFIWHQCMVGHRYNPETLVLEQNRVVEEHFWRVKGLLKEKAEMARTMASDARATVDSAVDPEYFDRQAQAAEEAEKRIENLLDDLGPDLFPGTPQKDTPDLESSGQGQAAKIHKPRGSETKGKKRGRGTPAPTSKQTVS